MRPAQPADLPSLYLMGFDVWSEGRSREEHLEACRTSKKYEKGRWYLLEDEAGRPVSGLITYALEPVDGVSAIGIGSFATPPALRRKGLGSRLLAETIRLLEEGQPSRIFYLHSEIDPGFYRKFGFKELPPRLQRNPGSLTMIRGPDEWVQSLLAEPSFVPPAYF